MWRRNRQLHEEIRSALAPDNRTIRLWVSSNGIKQNDENEQKSIKKRKRGKEKQERENKKVKTRGN